MGTQSLTDALRETLAVFDDSGTPRTTKEVAETLDLGRRSTYERLERLVDADQLATKKVGASARVWWRPNPSRPPEPQTQPALSGAATSLIYDVLDTVDVGILVLDEELTVAWANEAIERYFGVDRSSILGRDKPTLVADSFSQVVEQSASFTETVLDTYSDDAGPEQFECHVMPGADRAERWLEHRSKPIESGTYAGGRIELYYDITDTERKRREQELAQYETLFEESKDVNAVLSEDGTFQLVTASVSKVLGYEPEDLVGEVGFEYIHPDDRDEAMTAFSRMVADQNYEPRMEFRFRHADGDWVVLEVHGRNLLDDPNVGGIVVYTRDVTARRRREQELRRFERAIEASGHAIYMTDTDGTITYVNSAFEELTGYTAPEAVGETPAILSSGHHDPSYYRALWETISEGDVWEEEIVDERADGTRYHAEQTIAPVIDEDGTIDRFVAVQRDISDRKQRERLLQDRMHQQEVVARLGQRALGKHDLDELMADATAAVAETLDNDYCKVLDLDRERDELHLREGVGWDDGIVGSATVSAVEANSQAAYTLDTDEPVTVTDLTTEERFSGPALLTDHDVRSGISVLIGPTDDPWGILGTHDTAVTEFETHDVTFVQSVANIIATAIDRHDHEQELVRQREQLAALNNINEVVQRVSEAVMDQSTREEIEAVACEHLAAADSYLFAWIGDVDPDTQTLSLRTEAGVEGYLDDITISVDPDDERSAGATGRALRYGEIQTTQDIDSDDRYDPWRDRIEEYDFRSSAAIPIVHEDTVYGVLNVYAGRPRAFEGDERTVIAQLGEIIGHAIAATERKRALLSDEVVELEFRIEDVYASLGIEGAPEEPIELEHTVPLKEGRYLIFGTTTPAGIETVERLVETIPFYEEVNVRTVDDEVGFELLVTSPPVLSAIAALGGAVEEARIAAGDYHLTVHLSPSADLHHVIETVMETYPDADLVKRRQLTIRENDRPDRPDLTAALTDRQRMALNSALHAGFFEWPREATGEDVAELLDISPPTFHQHLRKAERSVFEELLTDGHSERHRFES